MDFPAKARDERLFVAMLIATHSLKGKPVRLILVSAVLAAAIAAPVSAAPLTYSECIGMLKAMLDSSDAIAMALPRQSQALATGMAAGSEASNKADKANVQARTDIPAAIKAYTDALGDACQAMR